MSGNPRLKRFTACAAGVQPAQESLFWTLCPGPQGVTHYREDGGGVFLQDPTSHSRLDCAELSEDREPEFISILHDSVSSWI